MSKHVEPNRQFMMKKPNLRRLHFDHDIVRRSLPSPFVFYLVDRSSPWEVWIASSPSLSESVLSLVACKQNA